MPHLTSHPRLTPLQRLWLCETVRLRESHSGPLEDSEANRLARQQGGSLARRIETRALWLAQRDGQVIALQHWLQGARLALGMLLLLAVLSGAGLAFTALGDGSRPVNVFWALLSLLGLHWLLLGGWLLSLLLPSQHSSSLGRLWLWLSEKFARDARAAQLGPALVLLLQRRQLNRWLLGLLIHSLWFVALLSALLLMLALLSTRRYGFVWETTLLDSHTFIGLTQWFGTLPALLGFAVPDAETIRGSGEVALSSEAARHAWSAWLIGLVTVFGLIPRLLLGVLCGCCWGLGRRHLSLDLQLPAYRLLAERLQPSSERLGIVDADPGANNPLSINTTPQTYSEDAVLVAIELAERPNWPPQLPSGVTYAGVLDSREQRRRLLDQLSHFPPARLTIACDPQRSPDRGTLALLGELTRSAASSRIWLLQADNGIALDNARLSDWHSALTAQGLQWTDRAPFNWLEHGHD